MENKAKQNSETKRNPRISAYRCSLSGNDAYIFPVNISERQLNSWSCSKLWQNTTEYQNLKMKEKLLWNSKFCPSASAHGCLLCRNQHWTRPIQKGIFFPTRWHFCFKNCRISILQVSVIVAVTDKMTQIPSKLVEHITQLGFASAERNKKNNFYKKHLLNTIFPLVLYSGMFHFSAEDRKWNLVGMHFPNEQFGHA